MATSYQFNEVAVGSDAEGFFRNKETGLHVPSVGILGGDKGDPIMCDGGGYLEDCVAWEINPIPATRGQGEEVFLSNIKKCLAAVEERANLLDLSVDISPAALFKRSDLMSEQASISGCSPTRNAWSMRRMRPVDLSSTRYRFASGDLHVSWPSIDDIGQPYLRFNLIRMMDVHIGLSEVAFCPVSKRIQYYGKAGIHRPTHYGVEYKTGGNFWLQSDERIKWAFRTVLSVWDRLSGSYPHKELILREHARDIMDIRNTWDSKRAKDYISYYEVERLPEL